MNKSNKEINKSKSITDRVAKFITKSRDSKIILDKQSQVKKSNECNNKTTNENKTGEENIREEMNIFDLTKGKSNQDFKEKIIKINQKILGDIVKKEQSPKPIKKCNNNKEENSIVKGEPNPDSQEQFYEIRTTNTSKQKSKYKIDNEKDNNIKKERLSQIPIKKESFTSKNMLNEKINIFDNKKNEKTDNNNNNDNNEKNEKENKEKENKEKEKKPKEKKNHCDQAILEKLKLFYQTSNKEKENNPSNKDKEKNNLNSNINENKNEKKNNELTNNSNKNLDNISKEKEISNENIISAKMTMHINDIKNKNKNDSIISSNIPKKLNLNEYFKKMNIDQISSHLKKDKKEEIMKFALHKKEEETLNNMADKKDLEQEQDQDQEQEQEQIQEKEEEEKEEKEIDNDYDDNLKKEEEELFEDKEKQENLYKDEDIYLTDNIIIEEKNINNEEVNTKPSNNDKKESKPMSFLSTLNKVLGLKKKKSYNTVNEIEKKEKISNNRIKEEKISNNIIKEEKSRKSIVLSRQLLKDFDKIESISQINRNSNIGINNSNSSMIESRASSTVSCGPNNEKNIILKKNSLNKQYTNPSSFGKKNEKENVRSTLPTSRSSIHFDKKSKSIRIQEILLDMVNISENDEKIKRNTFCESFFLASFPTENGKIVEKSEYDMADCKHHLCSQLPAMQPEIIYKYPEKDVKGIELNNLAASICFPNGIKICYEEKEEKIKAVKNFRSSFTNQIGERFFAVTYQFYLKMLNHEFGNVYNMFPIRYQLTTYQDELSSIFNDELEEDIIKKLELYSELNFRENVYIPFCLCLISRHPFYEQMEKCLDSVMMTIKKPDKSTYELNQLITYIVESIPAPPKKSNVYFALPHLYKICQIQYPYFEDILLFGDNPVIILKHLSISNIICVFRLLILEQKMLVVGKDNDIVSQIILNFVSLLYPFEWIHTYIPIMSEKMLKFLQAFLPFFNGMNFSLYQKAKPILAKASRGVFIIDVDEDSIDINSNLRKNAKNIKVNNYIYKNYPNLPKHIENLLYKELKSIKIDFEKTQNHNYDNYEINIRIRNLFLHVFVEMLYDYNKYSHIIDNYPVFNSYLLIKEKPKSDKGFYKELTSTQLFQMFIQNSFYNENDKQCYFDERIKDYLELKKNGFNAGLIYSELTKSFKRQYLSNFENNKNYVIKPYFIKNFGKEEEKYTSKNKSIKLRDIIAFMSKQYEPNNNYLNNQGVLKENKRIVDRPFILTHENDPNNYNIFIIPPSYLDSFTNNIIETNNKSENNSEPSSNKKIVTRKMTIISGDGDDNKKYSFYIRNKESLTEEQMDEIKDSIRETMTRVYKSQIKNIIEDEKKIMDCIKTQFGRDLFINSIPSGNKKDKVIKTVGKESFDFFRFIIFNSLLNILELEDNYENMTIAMKLTKTCLYIKTVKNKKEILLSDDLFFGLDNYSLFTKKQFWIIWIEDDMTESDIEIYHLIKQSKEKEENYIIDEEDENYQLYMKHSYDIIDKLSSIMIKMELSNSFIYTTITELIREYIFNDEIFDQLMKDMINELQFYKKLSIK